MNSNPKTDVNRPEGRLALLRACIVNEGGDVLAGLRLYTEETTAATSARLGLNPSTVTQCLNRMYGRRYETTRRALEIGLGLPVYSMDQILDGDK